MTILSGKYIDRTILILLAAAFVSCAGIEESAPETVGYLASSGVSVDVSVEEFSLTKASTDKTLSDLWTVGFTAPSSSDFHYKVTNSASNVVYDGNGLWTEALTLPVGSYTVEAVYGANAFDEPYFSGTVTGQIAALEQETVALVASLGNSVATVSVSNELDGHFIPDEGNSVTLFADDNGNKVQDPDELSMTTALGNPVFVPSGKTVVAQISGTSSAGVPAVFTCTFATAPNVLYNITCGRSDNWPSIALASDLSGGAFEGGLYFSAAETSNISDANVGEMVYEIKGGSYSDWTEASTTDAGAYKLIFGLTDGTEYVLRATVGSLHSEERTFTPVSFASCIDVTASAVHTTNSAQELDGTKVTADVTLDLPSLIAEIASVKADGSFRNSAAEERSALSVESLKNGANEIVMTNVSGWPYIPKDADCSLTTTFTCTLPANRTVTHESSITRIEVPSAMEYFNLKLEAYTSYSLYLDKQIDAANTCQPETLYKPGASWSISTDLMSNSNYLKSLSSSLVPTGSATPAWSVDFPNITEYGDNSYLENEVTSLDWTSYTLSAELTFAGETVQTQGTYHITGLPYKPSSMIEADWEFASWNCEYSNGVIQLGGVLGSGECTATSNMNFMLPAETRIKIKTNVTVRDYKIGLIWCQTTFTTKVNGTQIISQPGNKQDNGNTGKNYDLEGDSTFKQGECSIVLNSSYETAGPWSKVHSLHILYRK